MQIIDRLSMNVLRTGSVPNARMPKAYSTTLTINAGGADRSFFIHTDTMEEAIKDMLETIVGFILEKKEITPTP